MGASRVDAWPAVQAFIRANDVISAQVSNGVPIPSLNKADQLVGRSAVALGATLVTDDREFLASMRRAKHEAVQPWMIVRSHPTSLPDMVKIARFLDWKSDGGFVFARATPTNWAGAQTTERFAVFETDRQACLYFDSGFQQWVFKLAGLPPVCLPCVISRPIEHVVLAWVARRQASTSVVVCAWSQEAGHPLHRREEFSGKPTIHTRPRVSLGHRLDGSGHWNGHIREFVHAPGKTSTKAFKIFCEFSDVSPNPSDDDHLDDILRNFGRLRI